MNIVNLKYGLKRIHSLIDDHQLRSQLQVQSDAKRQKVELEEVAGDVTVSRKSNRDECDSEIECLIDNADMRSETWEGREDSVKEGNTNFVSDPDFNEDVTCDDVNLDDEEFTDELVHIINGEFPDQTITEFVNESEKVTKDVDDTKDASLIENPLKSRIQEQSPVKTEIEKKEEIANPNLEKKHVEQRKQVRDLHEQILEILKVKFQAKFEAYELKIINIIKDKDWQISKLKFELESKQFEQKSVEEKMKNNLMTTGHVITSLSNEKEELLLKLSESERMRHLSDKSVEEALLKDIQREKTITELKEQIDSSRAETKNVIAGKKLLMERFDKIQDENMNLVSKMEIFKADLEAKNTLFKEELEKLRITNYEAQETNKECQLKIFKMVEKEKEFLDKNLILIQEHQESERESENEILQKINIIHDKEEEIKNLKDEIRTLAAENMDLKSGLIDQKIDEDKRAKELEKNQILVRKEHEIMDLNQQSIQRDSELQKLKATEDKNKKKENKDLRVERKKESLDKNHLKNPHAKSSFSPWYSSFPQSQQQQNQRHHHQYYSPSYNESQRGWYNTFSRRQHNYGNFYNYNNGYRY